MRHHKGMPRAPGQSDFAPYRDEPPVDLHVPDAATEAPASATRVVYVIMFVLLAALLILTVVAPHIPAGE
jgi:hypothetical protein